MAVFGLCRDDVKGLTMRLILVLGDQLSDDLSALRDADFSRDIVVMAEVMAEGTYVPHHPQKIALVLTAMRKFAASLQARGVRVAYSRLDDPETGPSLPAELIRRMAETGADEVVVTMQGDWRLLSTLQALPLPLRVAPDAETEAVLAMVAACFPTHFGRLRPFHWPTDRTQALEALDHFITHSLPRFGDEQDAMLESDPFLSHSLLSASLNIGLLAPLEVCMRAEAAYRSGAAPLPAVEGFIRQIIGWREYVRGIWALKGPAYLTQNALNHSAALPPAYWGAPTKMNCLSKAVGQTRDLAYAHHIQRLMVTGNFALLAGVDPAAVHEWYLAVYIDAFEWVEAPNTLGMSQFADGGLLGSKPYVSSGAYIDRMSDYCSGCHYRVKDRTGPKACPFNPLYWHFLDRHRARFASNPRMAQ